MWPIAGDQRSVGADGVDLACHSVGPRSFYVEIPIFRSEGTGQKDRQASFTPVVHMSHLR